MAYDIPNILNKNLNIPTIGDSNGSVVSYDVDAQAYFDRVAAVRNIATVEKGKINSFILQLKADSLWNILTACWINRSGYNAAIGTTVYELKTNTKNGTLTNGASWGLDGVTLTGVTQYIPTGHVQTMNGTSSVLAVLKNGVTDTNVTGRVFASTAAGIDPTMLFLNGSNKASCSLGNFDGSTVNSPGGTPLNITSFKLIGSVYDPAQPSSQFSRFYNGSTIIQSGGLGSRLTASHTMTMGDQSTGLTAAVFSVGLVFGATALSAAQISLLLTNLKNTICSDQGLP